MCSTLKQMLENAKWKLKHRTHATSKRIREMKEVIIDLQKRLAECEAENDAK